MNKKTIIFNSFCPTFHFLFSNIKKAVLFNAYPWAIQQTLYYKSRSQINGYTLVVKHLTKIDSEQNN